MACACYRCETTDVPGPSETPRNHLLKAHWHGRKLKSASGTSEGACRTASGSLGEAVGNPVRDAERDGPAGHCAAAGGGHVGL